MIPIPDPNKIATGVRQLLDLLDDVLARRPRPAQIVAGIATVVLAPTSLVVGYFLTKEIESSKIYYTAGLLVALQICIWLVLVRTPRTGIASRNLGDKYLKDADAARLGGRGREAWSLYEKASGVYEQYGNTSGKLSCLRGIAELERLFGNTKSAEVIFIEAHGRSGDESFVICELNRGLGDLYRVRDELLRAQYYYDLAETSVGILATGWEHADLLTSKAHLQVKQGNATVAMALYNNAEELFSECNDIRGVMRVKMGRARLNTLFNRPAAAMAHAHDMRRWYIGTKNRIGEANVDLIVAENIMRSGTLPNQRSWSINAWQILSTTEIFLERDKPAC